MVSTASERSRVWTASTRVCVCVRCVGAPRLAPPSPLHSALKSRLFPLRRGPLLKTPPASESTSHFHGMHAKPNPGRLFLSASRPPLPDPVALERAAAHGSVWTVSELKGHNWGPLPPPHHLTTPRSPVIRSDPSPKDNGARVALQSLEGQLSD